MVRGHSKGGNIEHYIAENYSDASPYILEAVEKVITGKYKTEGPDTAVAILARSEGLSVAKRFYQTANTSGGRIFKEVVGYGRTQIVLMNRVSAYIAQKFESNLLDEAEIQRCIPYINEDVWLPVPFPILSINGAFHFNLYQPPQINPHMHWTPGDKGNSQNIRPELWQEFLDRWFPDNVTCQETLEAYMAKVIFDPLDRPRWAMIMRSDQGTGKNWLEEHIMSPLLGNTNVSSTHLDKITNRFNAGLFQRKLLIINEVNDDRTKTYDKLKDVVTDSFKTVEEKYQPVRQQPLYFGVWVFSNHSIPLYISPDDRRFFVTPRLTHRESKEETKEFLIDRFMPWLKGEGTESDAGLLDMASWLMAVSQNGYYGIDFGTVPLGGNRVSEMIIPDGDHELRLELEALLAIFADRYFQVDVIRKDARFGMMKKGDIKKVLTEEHWVYRRQLKAKDGSGESRRKSGWVLPPYGTEMNPANPWEPNETENYKANQNPDNFGVPY
jgi:hypothetical protein